MGIMAMAADELNNRRKKKFTEQLPHLVSACNPMELLPYLPCLTTRGRETIQCVQTQQSRSAAVQTLYDNLIRRDNWYEELQTALRHPEVKQSTIADLLVVTPKRKNETIYRRNQEWSATPDKTAPCCTGEERVCDLSAEILEPLRSLDGSSLRTWEDLAGLLGYTVTEVARLRSRRDGGSSYTLDLIHDWSTRRSAATLAALMNALVKLEQVSIVDKLARLTGYHPPELTPRHHIPCGPITQDVLEENTRCGLDDNVAVVPACTKKPPPLCPPGYSELPMTQDHNGTLQTGSHDNLTSDHNDGVPRPGSHDNFTSDHIDGVPRIGSHDNLTSEHSGAPRLAMTPGHIGLPQMVTTPNDRGVSRLDDRPGNHGDSAVTSGRDGSSKVVRQESEQPASCYSPTIDNKPPFLPEQSASSYSPTIDNKPPFLPEKLQSKVKGHDKDRPPSIPHGELLARNKGDNHIRSEDVTSEVDLISQPSDETNNYNTDSSAKSYKDKMKSFLSNNKNALLFGAVAIASFTILNKL